jgi:hypothetical protein
MYFEKSAKKIVINQPFQIDYLNTMHKKQFYPIIFQF